MIAHCNTRSQLLKTAKSKAAPKLMETTASSCKLWFTCKEGTFHIYRVKGEVKLPTTK